MNCFLPTCLLFSSYSYAWFGQFNKMSYVIQSTSNSLCCSVAKSCPTLCNSKDCSTPGFPAYYRLIVIAMPGLDNKKQGTIKSRWLKPKTIREERKQEWTGRWQPDWSPWNFWIWKLPESMNLGWNRLVWGRKGGLETLLDIDPVHTAASPFKINSHRCCLRRCTIVEYLCDEHVSLCSFFPASIFLRTWLGWNPSVITSTVVPVTGLACAALLVRSSEFRGWWRPGDAWAEVNLPDIWPVCHLRQRDYIFHFNSHKTCFGT